MAERNLRTDFAEGVVETLDYDDAAQMITHRRTQDVEPIVDAVALANLHGTQEIPGLGRLVAEVPITLAISFCDERGIPWEAFLYGNDYDAEFKRFIAAHQKLQYKHNKRVWGSC